jgi:HSP20 family protein
MFDLIARRRWNNLVDEILNESALPTFRSYASEFEKNAVFKPRVNSKETDEAYLLEFELPGIPKDDVDISVEENMLIVKAERSSPENEDENVVNEFSYRKFQRTATLPHGVNSSQIKAVHKDGILYLTIPKNKVQSKKVRIKSE